MLIRKYREEDVREIAALFYQTVHSVNLGDYSQEQVNVWADGETDVAGWNESLTKHYSIVSTEDGLITGFGDIDVKTGYLDRLYVHKDFQRQGIAAALCDELERQVKGTVTVHASITARPFFEKRGYLLKKENHVQRKKVLLTNYVMEKAAGFVPALNPENGGEAG